jgi:ABC-2 type transport system ATP-binding protein
MTNSITIRDISLKVSGLKLLNKVSFDLTVGDTLAILGTNGSGKSLLIDCMLGNIDCECKNNTLLNLLHDKRKLGILYDTFASFPLLKVKEVMSLLSEIYEKPFDERLITLLGIDKIQDKKMKVLSKGENKKMGIYCALFHHPEVIIMDEPVDGLDPIARSHFWNIITNVTSTVIFTTHLWNEIETCTNKLLLLHKGKALNEPMNINELKRTYCPYAGKIVVFNTGKHLFETDNFVTINNGQENGFCFYFANEVEKEVILEDISRKKINSFSILPIEIKDVYDYLIKK